MTAGEIRTMIRTMTLVEDTNVSDADLLTIINLGYKEIETAYPGWAWLHETASVGVTDGDRTATIPSDFNYILAVHDTVEDVQLEYMSPSSFLRAFGDRADEEGDPVVYTILDGEFYLYPTPDATDNDLLLCYYTENVATLGANDSPAFHAAFHWALVEYGKWKIFDREEYYDQSERARITFASYVQNMVSFYQNQVKRDPFMFGDGGPHGVHRDNVPWLWVI